VALEVAQQVGHAAFAVQPRKIELVAREVALDQLAPELHRLGLLLVADRRT
jgi:hypothetical protein